MGLELCGSKQQAKSCFKVEWGPCGRNGADGDPVWVRMAGGEPFRGGLGLCGSNQWATSRFEVEWGPCGRNGAFHTGMGPMQSKLAVSRGLASGMTQIKEVGAHKGAP